LEVGLPEAGRELECGGGAALKEVHLDGRGDVFLPRLILLLAVLLLLLFLLALLLPLLPLLLLLALLLLRGSATAN
jgi:hypothetical protein